MKKKNMAQALKLLTAQVAEYEQRLDHVEKALQLTIQRVCQLEAERAAERAKAKADAPTLPY